MSRSKAAASSCAESPQSRIQLPLSVTKGAALASRRRGRQPTAAPDPASDGSATGLVALVLQRAGVPRSNPQLSRALDWLTQHQDGTTGQWPASSLNKKRDPASDVGKFMSDAATAYAVMALVESFPGPRASSDELRFQDARARGHAAGAEEERHRRAAIGIDAARRANRRGERPVGRAPAARVEEMPHVRRAEPACGSLGRHTPVEPAAGGT